MKNNRIIWGFVVVLILITIAVSFGTMSSYSQKETPKGQNNNPFGDLSKYPVAEYNAPESDNAAEREERRIKNKRYDKKMPVLAKPRPDDIASFGFDVEPLPLAIPFNESRLIIVGEILTSKAFLSNEKEGIYSEYSVCIETILKKDKQKEWKTGETFVFDRSGGIVQYPNGQKMLYLIEWQDLPQENGRYILFLENDNEKNPNYRLLTAYQLKDNKVIALDHHSSFREFNGKSEAEFIKLVLSKTADAQQVTNNQR